jgi:hypothetical protein
MLAFANAHQIEYAKAALKDVRAAIDNWKDYAAQAGLRAESAETIAGQFPA